MHFFCDNSQARPSWCIRHGQTRARPNRNLEVLMRSLSALLVVSLALACHSSGDSNFDRKSAALGAQGAITFHLSYDSPDPLAADRTGGASRPRETGRPVEVGDGLYGQAEKATTQRLSWDKKNNVDLSRPGSAAFWV